MLTASEKNLHHQVKVLVASERKILSSLLEHLQQVYDTRLFAKMGHSSLIKYLVRELGYSESAAYRRHQALKLTKEIPKTKELVKTGELNLSNINQLQTIMHGKTTEDKEKAIGQIKGKTSKDTSDILFELNPEKKKDIPASKTRISTGMTRLSVTMSDTAMKKLNTLQARTKCYDNNQLIELALDLALSSTDMTKKKSRKSKGSAKARTITAKVKKEVLQRSQGKCEYPGCDEEHFLEWDHITPVAHGGTNQQSNIRLLCKAHNQREAIEKLGKEKMRQYLS